MSPLNLFRVSMWGTQELLELANWKTTIVKSGLRWHGRVATQMGLSNHGDYWGTDVAGDLPSDF